MSGCLGARGGLDVAGAVAHGTWDVGARAGLDVAGAVAHGTWDVGALRFGVGAWMGWAAVRAAVGARGWRGGLLRSDTFRADS